MAGAELALIIKARDEASKTLKGIGHETEGLGSKFAGLAKMGALALGAGTAAIGGMALKSAADFDQAMANIKAVSGATGEEFAALDKLAMQLGKDTVFSAKQAAGGIEELIKGGVGIPDVLNGAAKAMLNLATAGGVTLPESAEIASNALAMFSLKGSDMAHVADLIAGAANASSLTVSDFRFSLQMAGAVARTAGQTFDELAVAIAIMGKEGLKGSDAGTSLKTMMMNLNPTTKVQIAAMRDLGLMTAAGTSAFINANGSFKSMTEIAGLLNRATKDLTDSEKLLKLEMAFGADAVRVAAIMARQGAEGFTEMAKGMAKVTAESVAATKLDTLKGSLEQLRGSWETLLITIGKPMLPVIRGIVDGLTGFTNTLIENVFPTMEKFGPTWDRAIRLFQEVRVGNMEGFWLDLQSIVKDIASKLWEKVQEWGAAIVDWIEPQIEPLKAKLGEWAGALWKWLDAKLPEFTYKLLSEWVPAAIKWVIQAARDILPELGKFLDTIIGWSNTTGTPGAQEFGNKMGRAIVTGIIDGIKALIPSLLAALADLVGHISRTNIGLAPGFTIPGPEWGPGPAAPGGPEAMPQAFSPRALGSRAFTPMTISPRSSGGGGVTNIFNFGPDSVRSDNDIYRIASEVSRLQGSAVRVGA